VFQQLHARGIRRFAIMLVGALVAVTPLGSAQVANASVPSAAPGEITEFAPLSPDLSPYGITTGSDGALWFTYSFAFTNRAGRMSTDGVASERCLFTGNGAGITSGTDGKLWIATPSLFGGLVHVTPGGSCSGITLPTPPHFRSPQDVVAAPNGAIWFTEPTGNQIGRWEIAPFPQSSLTLFDVPTFASGVTDIAYGPDGALWFTEQAAGKIGRITTTGVFTEYALPNTGTSPTGITAGPDGALWFTEYYGNRIGRITTAGVISGFAIPTPTSGPRDITVGPDGALWFTEHVGDKIGRITTLGEITEFPLTAGSSPVGITSGPDGNIWFTEHGRRLIGRLTLMTDTTPPDIQSTVTPIANAVGWHKTDVTVTWSVTDAESGIESSNNCGSTTIAPETSGTTLTCSARNGAGLSATQSVTVRIDKTAPSIEFTGNAGTYTVDQSILITCAATDHLSGVATTSCPNVVSGPATDYLGLGATTTTTLPAIARDTAGNETTALTIFTVTVTADGICGLTASLTTGDEICTKATSIASAPNAAAKAGKLQAFDSFMNAQSGKSVPADLAELLSRLAHLL
jgi:streptogramin lyase